MATIEDFVLRMKVEGQGSLRNVSATVQNLKDDFADLGQVGGPLGSTINGIIGKLGPLGIAASIAASAFAGFGLKALQISGEMEDISGSTGITTGVINSFAGSLIFAGGKAEDAANILQKLNQSVQEAAGGNEALQKSFQELGVFVTDASGKVRSTEAILQDLTRRFQEGELSPRQYGAAIDILGKNIRALELGKLQAINDPAYTEATKNIDRLNDSIDILVKQVKDGLIITFGDFAKALNQGGISGLLARITESIGNLTAEILNLPTDYLAKFLNLFGANIQNPVGLGTPLKALTEQAKKERLAYQAEQERLRTLQEQQRKQQQDQQRKPGPVTPLGPAGGGFGTTPEAVIKAQEGSAKRLAQSQIEQQRQTQLAANSERLAALIVFGNQQEALEVRAEAAVRDIKINSAAELAKSRLEIFDQEKLTEAQKQKEFAAKEKEIRLKEVTEISKIRTSLTEQLLREQQKIQDIITQSKARVEEERKLNEVLDQRNKFVNENAAATDLERKRAQEIFDLEQERLKVLRQIALIKDIPPQERLAREKEINEIFEQRKQKTIAQQEADQRLTQNFSAGFEKAYRQYAENARNAFERGSKIFATFTQGMEDSIVNFVKTGKLNFMDLVNTLLEEILRAEIRLLASNIMGSMRGSGGGSGNFLGNLLGFANGGIIPTNGPVIVGERGPELLMGASGSRVVPNGQFGGGSVTYNINAVDAASFKSMIARDPGFIHAVAQQGARTVSRR
jgi:lambda family phage tail tape measure protein